MASLFSRLQRYHRTPGRNAQEDRLTEALAATLEAAPDASRYLVEEKFGHELGTKVRLATQVRRPGLRPDLELCFGGTSQPDLRVWFESKVDSQPYRHQGALYMDELDRLGDPWLFSWLIPLGQEIEGGLPKGATVMTWQELGRFLRDWLRNQVPDRAGPYLVGQFLEHLEKEEKLAFTNALEKEDAQALGNYEVARGRLDELLRQTKLMLEEKWTFATEDQDWGRRRSRDLPDFHLIPQCGTAAAWPEGAWFEWHGRRDDARERADGSWVTGAGWAFALADAPNEADFQTWFQDLRGAGFEYGLGGWKNEYRYIFQYLTLTELVGQFEGSDVGVQARQLADWVTGTLDALTALGAPKPTGRSSGQGVRGR